MVVTAEEVLANRVRLLRIHGGAKQYHHDEVGINSRLDTLQAAVLLAKLPHLREWNAKRRRQLRRPTHVVAGHLKTYAILLSPSQ